MNEMIITKRSSILDVNKAKFGDHVRKFGLNWYFETALEKIILVVLGTLGLWKLVDLIKQWLM